jgi:hypothetical protein|tara:strand:+ start:2265 stop:2897 length:633 start_codon:yes stop_codon:yes gene_type:complete
MEQNMFEELDPKGVEAISQAGRPIPGQSLTNSPDAPYPWEGSSRFTNFKEALDYVVSELIVEENYLSIVSGIGQGVSVSDVVMQVLYAGFKEGQWNPDLMMMLLEPLMYVVIALCEKAGVEYTLYDGDEDEDETELEEDAKNKFEQIQKLTKSKMPTKESISKTAVPAEILQKIEELPLQAGILEKQEPVQPQESQEQAQPSMSLLGKQE